MKSAYENPAFSKFWHQISGKHGHSYKRFVIDPAAFKILGSLKNKTILDLGCGNGYLGPEFVLRGAKQVMLMDISSHNLKYARELNKECLKQIQFIQQDATRKWK